jgi:hypothetical protein
LYAPTPSPGSRHVSLQRFVRSDYGHLFAGHLGLQQVMCYAKSNADLQRSALALLGGNTDCTP